MNLINSIYFMSSIKDNVEAVSIGLAYFDD